jgi:hypothetical protein
MTIPPGDTSFDEGEVRLANRGNGSDISGRGVVCNNSKWNGLRGRYAKERDQQKSRKD